MRCVVCIKQVPDTSEVKIDPATNNLVRDGIPSILNPSDYSAIVKALTLRKETGGTVTLLSMGPEQVRKELEMGLRMGADRAILLSDRRLGGADTLATSYTLAAAIERIGYDLILCGNEAIDGCTGQVGPMIGEFENIPVFTNVENFTVRQNELGVTRLTETTTETYHFSLPALISVVKTDETMEENETTVPIEVWNADFLEEDRIGSKGSPTKVAEISVSGRPSGYLKVDYRWNLETRMEYIFRGGMEEKNTPLTRGTPKELADILLNKYFAVQ